MTTGLRRVCAFLVSLAILTLVVGIEAESQAGVTAKAAGVVPVASSAVEGVSVLRLIRFTGSARGAHGQPLAGVVGVTFALYEEQEGGAQLWLETQNVSLDPQGRYTALLGATSKDGLPLEVFTSGEARWLGIQVQGQAEQRVLLVSVPYALKAAEAETLSGKTASDFLLSEQLSTQVEQEITTQIEAQGLLTSEEAGNLAQVTGSGTVGQIAKFVTSTEVGDSVITEANGRIGIGFASPVQKLVIGAPGGRMLNVSNLSNQDLEIRLSKRLAADKHALIAPTTPTSLALGVGGQEKMRITNAGNVGIGTKTPEARLEVVGSGVVTGAFLVNTGSRITQGTSLPITGFHPVSTPNPGTIIENSVAPAETAGFFANSDFAMIWSPGDQGLLRVYDEDLFASGDATALRFLVNNNSAWVNAGGPDGFSAVYFYEDGSPTGESLGWRDSDDQFEFSDDLEVEGKITAQTGEIITTDLIQQVTFNSASVVVEGKDTRANTGIGVRGEGGSQGVLGVSSGTSGFGVNAFASANSGSTVGVNATVQSASGTAGVFDNTAGGDILLGRVNGVDKFRVDGTGKGFFNGGTQTGGADFAESLQAFGSRGDYEPGDVLVIDPGADRRVTRADEPYSQRVAGIYSTKPGILATPHQMDDPRLAGEIPLAIVGIVPCKVSAENGSIERGDLLVTASTPGHAMKGTDRDRMLGAVVGKALGALQAGSGVIEVLVTLQ